MPRCLAAALSLLLVLLSGRLPASPCEGLTLTRALLTDRVEDREPGDAVTQVTDQGALFAFTEVEGGAGRTLVHRWSHQGDIAADIPLAVRGDRWRTWSSKNLGLRRDNNWQVEVLDDQGCVLTVLALNPAPDPLLAPVQQLLERGQLGDAKLALAGLQKAHPDKAAQLNGQIRPWLVLASAQREIREDQLYLARSRLEGLDSPDQSLIRRRDQALMELAARQRVLDHELALKLEARESLARDKPLPCALTEEEVDDWLASAGLEALTVMDRVAGETRLEMELLDTRTGTSHTLTLPCVGTPGSPR